MAKSIYEMKQFSKNLEMTVDAYNDLKSRARNTGYRLFEERIHYHHISTRGGYWIHRSQIWANGENCVRINWCTWNWGCDYPERYAFDGRYVA